jgi:hypothetical protein
MESTCQQDGTLDTNSRSTSSYSETRFHGRFLPRFPLREYVFRMGSYATSDFLKQILSCTSSFVLPLPIMILQSGSTSLSIWITDGTVFFVMFGTLGLNIAIYSTLHTRLHPESMVSTSSLEPLSPRVSELDTRSINRAARYMIIYPTIYVLCTLPLA